MVQKFLEINQLSLKRGERWLWQELKFGIKTGEWLQITGENGSGKTSLLRVLAGLAQPTSGNLNWQGQPVKKEMLAYQEQLHYLGHQTAVKMDLTVFENLSLSIHQSLRISEINKVLDSVSLSTFKHTPLYALSQGQKQRVGLARLLLHEVPLWILDEPFAGLDQDMIIRIQKIFAEKLAREGLIILTSHQPLNLSLQTGQVLNLDHEKIS